MKSIKVMLVALLAAFLLLPLEGWMQETKAKAEKKEQEEEETIQVMHRIELKNPLRPGRTHEMEVMSNIAWTDSGYDVYEGQTVHFSADRFQKISLQRGNPVAWCGPDGMEYSTVQKIIKDQNLGALIGRVVRLVSIEIDEETGEEVRNEVERIFFIGSENIVTIPMDGRLHLGINELVYPDNGGTFRVRFYLR